MTDDESECGSDEDDFSDCEDPEEDDGEYYVLGDATFSDEEDWDREEHPILSNPVARHGQGKEKCATLSDSIQKLLDIFQH